MIELLKMIQGPLLKLQSLPRQFSFLQRTVGTILSTLVTDCNGLKLWPSLLLDLLQLISGYDNNTANSVFSSIDKICEDAAFELIEYPETFKPFLGEILNLLQQCKDEILRTRLISIICHLIPTQAALLTENVNFILNCVLVPSESVELQISSCRLLSTLIEFYWTFLSRENVKTIFKYVFTLTANGTDRDLLKQCGEFWLLQVQADSAIEQFQATPEILSQLIPVLMDRCVYDDEEDEDELCLAMEDLSVPDEEEDFKPRHRKSEGENEEEEENDFEETVISSLRKCSAATLDGLSLCTSPTHFLNIFLAAFNTRVASSDWKIREGALLALGAVAEGLWPHLKDDQLEQVVSFLLANAQNHPHPLVRSMSLWTLSRLTSWLTGEEGDATFCEKHTTDADTLRLGLLEEALRLLIGSLGDANKRVQQSCATALCKFLESSNSATFFTPLHRKSLISAIFLALKCYQRRSLLILFDLIRIFAQIGFPENLLQFDQESFMYWRQIATDLVDRLGPQSIADSSIFSVIEALMALLLLDFEGKLLDPGKREEMEFKALTLAAQNLTALNETKAEGFAESIVSEGLDDFLIAALDLLAAAYESSKLVPASSLQPLLKNILAASLHFTESTTVRQSAFALFGDYALNCPEILVDLEAPYFSAVDANLCPTSLTGTRSQQLLVSMATATNALWSLGEYSLHTVIPSHLPANLIIILKDRPTLEPGSRIYFENLAVCIGRILTRTRSDSEISGVFLNRILNLLSTVESESERTSAFTGLINFYRNATGLLSERDYQIFISKLNDLLDFSSPETLHPDLSQKLTGFTHPHVPTSFYSRLQPLLRHLLLNK